MTLPHVLDSFGCASRQRVNKKSLTPWRERWLEHVLVFDRTGRSEPLSRAEGLLPVPPQEATTLCWHGGRRRSRSPCVMVPSPVLPRAPGAHALRASCLVARLLLLVFESVLDHSCRDLRTSGRPSALWSLRARGLPSCLRRLPQHHGRLLSLALKRRWRWRWRCSCAPSRSRESESRALSAPFRSIRPICPHS